MRRILITGATSGIGFELAKIYASEAWHVFACGRRIEPLNELAQQYQNFNILQFDVSSKEEVQHNLSVLEYDFDLIILNAGTCEYIDNGKVDTELFRRVFEANFFGVLHCIEALQAKFTSSTHLALMGSTAAYLPFPRSEAYGASKAAISYLTHSLSVTLEQHGMKVSLISPGFVQTPLTDRNDFAMPMIITAEQAAQIIHKELAKGKVEIHFPKKFSRALKLISMLPIKLQRKLMSKLSRKIE